MAFTFRHSRRDQDVISIPAIGLDVSVRLPVEASGGALAIIETTNAPNFGPPLHRHRETEVFRVLVGRYLFQDDDQMFLADAGDVISVPGGVAHAFVNVSDDPARQIVMILPGFDAALFFASLGTVMEDGIPDREVLNRFGQDWGVEFLGPPIPTS
jgi:quercetin dioxygenase-like cupin family protein